MAHPPSAADPLPADPAEMARALADEVRALVAGERDWVANLANAAAHLWRRLPRLNWAGFYLWRGDGLVLGPFQGRPACVRIARGRGVCGAAAARRTAVLVPDVHAFPGHIACDAASASELVAPILAGDRLIGVIDLDSPEPARFTDAERAAVEAVAAVLAEASDWPADIGQPGDAAEPPPPAPRPGAIADAAEYRRLHERSLADPEGFWPEQIPTVRWDRKPERVLTGAGPEARWFPGGRLNLAANCLDVHIDAGRGDQPALVWEGEAVDGERRPRERRAWTYRELRAAVAAAAGALAELGVGSGDTVTISLPVVPELPIAMLACAWLGATHNVVFAGFPPQALADRIRDAGSRVVITADAGWRGGRRLPLKPAVDEAARLAPQVEHVLVVRHAGGEAAWTLGRDRWWHEAVRAAAPSPAPRAVDSDHPLFLMYTSGSTGKPKGIEHGTAGYLVHALTSARHAFDLRPGDVHWCTADPAWITGHTYTVYAPLLAGATTLLYEGVLSFPDWDRAWDIVERHRPRTLYTTPTLIRAWIRHGEAGLRRRDRSSLRILGSVGEPIGPAAWRWFRDAVGEGRAAVVDTWWQTEVGAAAIFTPPYAAPAKPGSAGLPFFGIAPAIVGADGAAVDGPGRGQLVLTRPWPGQARGIRDDAARWRAAYWQAVPGAYATGDAAARDADGYLRIHGRTDDVIKVNGHRLGTAEVEAAIAAHPAVSEAAAIAVPDERTGEAIIAFVVARRRGEDGEAAAAGIVRAVEERVGKLARPREVRFLDALPKNRSGKILRRLLRGYALTGRFDGDLTTLDDATAPPLAQAGA